jgi:hypothetical protein
MLELNLDNFLQFTRTIDMKLHRSAEQVHAGKKAHQSQVMITMKVTDKNMIDPLEFQLKPAQLHLGAFATVDQKKPLSYV